MRNREESPTGNKQSSVSIYKLAMGRIQNMLDYSYPAVYADIKKQAFRTLGRTLIDVWVIAIMKGECDILGASAAGLASGRYKSGSMKLMFNPTRKEARI
jgi:hypothetical protein